MSRKEDLDNMSEARRIQYERWLGGTSDPVWAPSPRQPRHATSAGSPWVMVALIALLALGGFLSRAPRPTSYPAPALATQPPVVHAHRASAPLGEPPTSTAPPWTPTSPSGRLIVVSEHSGPSAYLQLTRDRLTWEGFVRSGETASIELVPGQYSMAIRPRDSKLSPSPPMRVDIQSPTDVRTFRVDLR